MSKEDDNKSLIKIHKLSDYEAIRKEFIDCVLKHSKCIRTGKSFKDCLNVNDFPTECEIERKNLYDFKRLNQDRRYRFRNRS